MLDLSPLLDPLVQALLGIVSVVVAWGAKEGASLLGAKRDGEIAKTIEKVASNAVRWAIDKARDEAKDITTVPVKNEVVRDAVNAVAEMVPKALKRFGADPTTEAGKKRIEKFVRAQLSGGDETAAEASAG